MAFATEPINLLGKFVGNRLRGMITPEEGIEHNPDSPTDKSHNNQRLHRSVLRGREWVKV
jgi:hypothetical protein